MLVTHTPPWGLRWDAIVRERQEGMGRVGDVS